MNYINHITITSGHSRKSYPSEVDKAIYFRLKRIYKDMFTKNGAEVQDGYIAKATEEKGNGIVITIFDSEGMPVLTTGITNNKNNTVWETLHSSSMLPTKTDVSKPPKVPYIADRLEIGAIVHSEAMKWTGDFTRCMGWICLKPEAIR